MTLVGFKRMTIGIFDETGKVPEENKIVIEGKQDKGATVTAEIKGLAKEATKVYGSNIAYYISQKGTGDVTVDIDILDMSEDGADKILGLKTSENGISYYGEDTEPPYCSVLLESEDLSGDKVLFGLFKGKFSADSKKMETTTNDALKPEAESYTFSAVSDDKAGDSNGQTVGKYIGSEEASVKALNDQLFPSIA